MAEDVAWLESPRLARRFARIILGGVVAMGLGEAAIYIWNPVAWTATLRFVFLYPLIVSCWAAVLLQIPVRVGVDGMNLRIRYLAEESTVPLGDVLVADLAPGATREQSVLRLAHRQGRTVALGLESPAAEGLAFALERAEIHVNRNPPPSFGLPRGVSR